MAKSVALIATETLIGLYASERTPEHVAEMILRAVHEADQHRLSESAPMAHGYYVKCVCGRHFVRNLLDDAQEEQRTHQSEETFATFATFPDPQDSAT